MIVSQQGTSQGLGLSSLKFGVRVEHTSVSLSSLRIRGISGGLRAAYTAIILDFGGTLEMETFRGLGFRFQC